MAVAFREFDASWQVLYDRVGESDFVLLDHVGQQERGKYFGNRGDLKSGIAVEWSRVSLIEMTVGDNSPAFGADYSNNDADAIFLAGEGVDPSGEHLANFSIGGDSERARILPELSPCNTD